MQKRILLPAPDGVSDQFETIQNALNGGNVIVELAPGLYPVSKTLHVDSHTTIRATPQTVIRRMDHTAHDADDCLICNSAFNGAGNESIELDGGIWDLNCFANPRGKDIKKDFGGLALRFDRVTDLTIRDLTVSNPETYFIRLCRITDFRILNVKLFSSFHRPNQDGVHMNGFCFHGVIRGLHAISPLTPNDDMIALNACDGLDGQNTGIELGPIEDIEIEDVYAESAYGFFRTLTETKEQSIRNIRVKNCRGGVRFFFLNADTFFDIKPGSGLIENVEFSDIDVHKMPYGYDSDPDTYDCFPLFGIQLKMENVTFRNVQRTPLDTNCGRNTLRLHPDAGSILEFEADPDNKCQLNTAENGVITLPDGGFRLLRIGSIK